MMASESCSPSSSSGDDFVPTFLLRKVLKSPRRSYDKKRSTKRWMKQTQLLAAAEAQSGENKSDPDLDLCPPASPVGNTFWCQCGECFARDRRKDCVCCFDYVERVEKVHSASNDCT